MDSPSISGRVGMAAEMNHNDYVTRAMSRMASVNRHDTIEPARISREVHGLVTPGFGFQAPPDMARRAEVGAETNHIWRNNAIALMQRTPRRNTFDLPRIHREVQGLEIPGLVSQNHDSHEPALQSGDPLPERLRSESYHQSVEVRMHQMREGIQAHQANMLNEMNDDASEAPSNRAETFLEALPRLSLTDLPKDNQDCPICMEQYYTPQHYEPAVRLPCDHIMGKDCMLGWLNSSVLNRNNNTCPMCRTVFFKRDIAAFRNQLRGIDGILDRVPEAATRRVQNELARLDGVMNRLRSDDEQREMLARSRDSTRTRLEQLNASNAASSDILARLQDTTRSRDGRLNGSYPASREVSSHDVLARLQSASRARREQSGAALSEMLARAQDTRWTRTDLGAGDAEIAEIAARRDHLGPRRERRGAI